MRIEWHTVFDEHTCPACSIMDGMTETLVAPPHPECVNPDGCRCVFVPVLATCQVWPDCEPSQCARCGSRCLAQEEPGSPLLACTDCETVQAECPNCRTARAEAKERT